MSVVVNVSHISGADPGFFFRRGCARLLLYFNTNKPHIFFLQNTSCIRKPQVISGGGGEGGAHPLHPPPRSAPVYDGYTTYLYYLKVAEKGAKKSLQKSLQKSLKKVARKVVNSRKVSGFLHVTSEPP